MDDGKREVALSLGLDPAQFNAIDGKLGGIDGAINRLAENVSPVDTSIAAEIALLKEMVSVGFADMAQGLANLNNTIFDASNNIGKWLAAIALAAANPADNTAEVQAHIDKLTTQIKQQADAVSAAVDNAKET
jgi:uncharacterized phage infection (PIP) family protein YhgE